MCSASPPGPHRRCVLPLRHALSEFVEKGRQFGVQKYVAVGTAALRRANNSQELLDLVQQFLGLRVSILEREEEAYLSLLSVFVHFSEQLREQQPILLIDQGGGSTELSCGQLRNDRYDFLGLSSLDLGSIFLKNHFLEDEERSVREAYLETLGIIQDKVGEAPRFKSKAGRSPIRAFGMGSAITNVTRMRGNRQQHGYSMSDRWLQRILDARQELYSSDEGSIVSLLEDHDDAERKEQLERDMLMLYGLPVYQQLLRHYNLSEITVCGYGLRYGVFFYFAFPRVVQRHIAMHFSSADEVRPLP